MISLDAILLRTAATDALRSLDVDDFVSVVDVRVSSDGVVWYVHFEDRWPDTRFLRFVADINLDSAQQAQQASAQELSVWARAMFRLMLREKLWICPRCQKRAFIRRIVDTDVFRVECDRCGRFEIEREALELF